jgi:hypothetical protein
MLSRISFACGRCKDFAPHVPHNVALRDTVGIAFYLPQLSSRSVILRLIPRIRRLRFRPNVLNSK